MSALTFTLQQEPVQRLDLSALTPQRLADKSIAEIERIELCGGRNRITVGDCFRVSGTTGESIVLEGGSSRFDLIGAELMGGTILVTGDAGALLGRRMSGGFITVEGSAGQLAGSQMTDGRIEIKGDAGNLAGGPAAGEMRGMAGGTLIIRGRAGDRLGDRMRRGTIAALGGCGDHAGSRMIAGTILIQGGAGRLPGYLMRRGSILLDRAPQELSPTFIPSGPWFSAFTALLDRELIKDGIVEQPFLGNGPMRYVGDMAVPGKGELIISAG